MVILLVPEADAGFGPETYAEHVCSYVMQEIVARGWVNKK